MLPLCTQKFLQPFEQSIILHRLFMWYKISFLWEVIFYIYIYIHSISTVENQMHCHCTRCRMFRTSFEHSYVNIYACVDVNIIL